MKLIILAIIILLLFFALKWFARTETKKISKKIRSLFILFSIVLAIILAFAGRIIFAAPFLLMLLPLLKIKGLTAFQIFQLWRLLNYLRQTGRFSYGSGSNYSQASSNLSLDDAYKILGARKGCSKEEIIEKYKKIMSKLHPDKNKDLNTTKLAQIVSEAKETILKNDFKKS